MSLAHDPSSPRRVATREAPPESVVQASEMRVTRFTSKMTPGCVLKISPPPKKTVAFAFFPLFPLKKPSGSPKKTLTNTQRDTQKPRPSPSRRSRNGRGLKMGTPKWLAQRPMERPKPAAHILAVDFDPQMTSGFIVTHKYDESPARAL